jgi:hypothetical protein
VNARAGKPDVDIPTLVIAFELERRPRALNAHDLTEAELARLVDWINAHGRMDLHGFLERHLAYRERRAA